MVNNKILFKGTSKIFGPQTASVLLLRNESQERNQFFFLNMRSSQLLLGEKENK